MYTRTYSNESGIVIPERYGGTSLGGTVRDEACSTPPYENQGREDENEIEGAVHTENGEGESEAVSASSFLSKLSFSRIFPNILKNDFFSLQSIGKEEILIIVTAAFLLFSKEGDKECAIMLLLLLLFK